MKVKGFIKNNIKVLVAFIIGILVSGVTVYAVTVASSSVSYNNSTSGATSTNVQGALDELYDTAKSCKVKSVSFAEDSWDRIISNVQNGYSGVYEVGDTKTVDMGTLGTHTLRVANNSTPPECFSEGFSETACGFVLEFADIITTHQMNPYTNGSTNGDGNKGGWEYSEMRTYVNQDVYNALPELLQNAIANTTVVSGHGSNDSSNFTTTDKLYLLSTKEVWGKEGTSNVINYDTAETETRQLDYYKNNNVTTSSYAGAIKKNKTSNSWWWLRSAYSNSNHYFFGVTGNGYWNYINSYYTYGVSPAFRIA